MRLNGWQRLWVVLAALWFPVTVWQFVTIGDGSATSIGLGILVCATPLALLYAAGLTVAWVRRGFERQQAR